ncbi:MAG: hypothetical protein PVG85_06125, partial [Deltaproteobacteria bacterium]
MKRAPVPKRKRIGEILVSQGRLTPEQLAEFLRFQKQTSKRLGDILVENGILSKEELAFSLGEQLGIPHVWLRKGLVDPRIVRVLPREKALQFQVIPMFRVHDTLTLATADAHALFVFDEVAKITNLQVQPVLCRTDDIMEAIRTHYDKEVGMDDLMADVDEAALDLVPDASERDIEEIAEMAEGSPVINLTNRILLKAIRDGVSDIHIEPDRNKFRVRVRIDGV